MTLTVLSCALAVLTIVVLVLLSAQVEMYRNLEQLRIQSGLIDRAVPVDLGESKGRQPSSFGLPSHLDLEVSALVLFLSDKCAACRSIVAGLGGTVPSEVFLVIDPGVAGRDSELTVGIPPGETTALVDWESSIASAVGITATPTGVIVANGRVSHAATLPSTREFFAMLGSVKAVKAETRRVTSVEGKAL
ncbi:MAG: hypothetical protein M3R63_06740 [Actinomycetota bacterium]|nr:hypothetical protein [Actinomycetota bacterium]